MRDKLVELIMECRTYTPNYTEQAKLHAKYLAQHLLNAGVILPPCKVGDTVYCIWQYSDFAITEPPFIKPAKAESFVIDEGTIKVFPDNYSEMDDHWFRLLDIVFTQEEAEKALAERSENEHRKRD